MTDFKVKTNMLAFPVKKVIRQFIKDMSSKVTSFQRFFK